jgi:TonB family protein
MNCGAMLLQGVAVCPVCQQPLAPPQPVGAAWPQQQQQQQSTPPVAPWPQQPPAPPPGAGGTSKGLNVVLLVVIGFVVLLLVAGGAGAFVYLKNRAVTRVNKEREESTDPVKAIPEPPTPNSDSTTGKNRTPNNSRPISGGLLNGKAISLPRPPYPAIAKAAHASGTVVVQVTIDEGGSVTNARAVSGHPLLQASATQAAYQARFSPTLLAGKPVKVTGVLTYNFAPE